MNRDLQVFKGADFNEEFSDGETLVGWRVTAAIKWRPGGADTLYVPAVRVAGDSATMSIPGSHSVQWSWNRVHYEVIARGPNGKMRYLGRGRLVAD